MNKYSTFEYYSAKPLAFSDDDPEQITAEIGMLMSGMTTERREDVQQRLTEIGDSYDSDARFALQVLRDSIVHDSDYVIFTSEHHVTRTGVARPRQNTVNSVRVTTPVNAVRFLSSGDKNGANTGSKRMPRPPASAEKLLYLLPKTIRDAILGDLEEDFAVVANKFGRRYARRWYWWHLSLSIVYSMSRKLSKLTKFWRYIGGS